MPQLILLPDKERPQFRRHPWVFATAVGRLEGKVRPGDTVEVLSDKLKHLGRAAYSPDSPVRARMWTFDPDESIDDVFFKRRVALSVARRRTLPELAHQDGVRLIHGESDGLPGVIADRYGDTVVIQLTSAGADKWRKAIVAALVRETGCVRVYERSDSDVRGLDGLAPVTGWVHGEAPAETVSILENGIRLGIDFEAGHKTGFYLDQRDNRKLLGGLSQGRTVLNCFCYTGGFSLQALAGGAPHVLSIDASGPALAQASANLALNPNLPADRAEWLEADVFEALRTFRKEGRLFDRIVLDPPKFAPTVAHAERAARAYKDINRLAFKLLEPGGVLFTYSCSGGISADLFHKIVASAGIDAGVDGYIGERLSGAPDHPMTIDFPEGEYLKGLVIVRKPEI